jgi:hypothetical protein
MKYSIIGCYVFSDNGSKYSLYKFIDDDAANYEKTRTTSILNELGTMKTNLHNASLHFGEAIEQAHLGIVNAMALSNRLKLQAIEFSHSLELKKIVQVMLIKYRKPDFRQFLRSFNAVLVFSVT